MPAEGGFSSNVIVAIQLTKSSKDAYREQSLEQFKQLDFKVNSEHFARSPAVMLSDSITRGGSMGP